MAEGTVQVVEEAAEGVAKKKLDGQNPTPGGVFAYLFILSDMRGFRFVKSDSRWVTGKNKILFELAPCRDLVDFGKLMIL